MRAKVDSKVATAMPPGQLLLNIVLFTFLQHRPATSTIKTAAPKSASGSQQASTLRRSQPRLPTALSGPSVPSCCLVPKTAGSVALLWSLQIASLAVLTTAGVHASPARP